MRFLGIGDYHGLGDMYLRLASAGHEVRVHVHEPEAHGILQGLVTRIDDWRAELPWIRAAGRDGIVVFETAHHGDIADALRRDGYQVVGGSAWGDRLERDRAFGQAIMRDAGMPIAAVHDFRDFEQALAFLAEHPGRYVYKLSGGEGRATQNYVGELDDGFDVAAVLRLERDRWNAPAAPHFVLMEHVAGIEVGVGGYFDGERFLTPAVIDWEHKRLFSGDLGELTGEMGTVVSYRGAEAIFEQTLGRLAEPLREAGHVGYLNINTIVNERGIWPLEFTCRFGYPGFAICDALHLDGWDEILRRMTRGDHGSFATRDGFAVGVVLTVPPYPYEFGYEQLSKDAPIFFRPGITEAQRAQLHYGEVAQAGEQLVTRGFWGYVMVATGTGMDIAAAKTSAYATARQVVVPKLRYRVDIGDRLLGGELDQLRRWGYYPH